MNGNSLPQSQTTITGTTSSDATSQPLSADSGKPLTQKSTSELEESKPSRSKGRPKGSKNRRSGAVVIIDGECPRCGGDMVITGRDVRKPMTGGFRLQDKIYGMVEFKRVQCKDCEHVAIGKRYSKARDAHE